MEYNGKTKDAKYHGYAILRENGLTFRGTFKDGIANGYGILNDDNGLSVSGTFVNGLLNGYTTIIAANGYWYKGTFKDHLRHGIGIEQMPGQEPVYGYYENDVRVKVFEGL